MAKAPTTDTIAAELTVPEWVLLFCLAPQRAHHARAERWHWHVVGPPIGAQHHRMVA
jgi:hypothetical protein